METDKTKSASIFSKMSMTELNAFMSKHGLHSHYLLAWDDELYKTQEEYEEAMRQGHVARLTRMVVWKPREKKSLVEPV